MTDARAELLGRIRSATHGAPSDENSHPHLDQSGKVAVVHNGVIENYDKLKDRLGQPVVVVLGQTF